MLNNFQGPHSLDFVLYESTLYVQNTVTNAAAAAAAFQYFELSLLSLLF